MFGYFLHAFLSSADFFLFSKSTFSKNSLRNTIRETNSLDPDLGSNCLQRLSADDTSRQRVKFVDGQYWTAIE